MNYLQRRPIAGNHPIYDPRFDDPNLTEAINVAPYRTGRLAQLGLFVDSFIARTTIKIGRSEKTITVIPSAERGGPANLAMRPDKHGIISATIPHFPLDDAISPADIQDASSFDPDGALLTVEQVYADKLDNLRAHHDQTHHHLDSGALNGQVLDADGKLLFDTFNAFGIEQNVVKFDFDSQTFDVAAQGRSAKTLLTRELRGTAATGIRVLAGPSFYERVLKHKSVIEALKAYPGVTPNPARDEVEETFAFAGLLYERFDEEYFVRSADGTILKRPSIAEDEAILLPFGTPFFKRYIAPPDTISGANRPPDASTKVFISTEDLPHDKGRHIHSESNVLPICLRPELMIRFKVGK